jgi:multisubunit Na+/H+ antiporter MnhF subunit
MFYAVLVILLISMFLLLFRFLKGPSFGDRVVAFDIISVMSLSFLVLLALHFKREIYIDIALVFALIGFLGSAIFGRYIEDGI